MPWVRDEPRRQDMPRVQPRIPGQRIPPPGGYAAGARTSPAQVEVPRAEPRPSPPYFVVERETAPYLGAGEEFGKAGEVVKSVAEEVFEYGKKAASGAVEAVKDVVKELPAAAGYVTGTGQAGEAAADVLKDVSSATAGAAGDAVSAMERRIDEALRDIAGIGGSIQNKIDATERLLDQLPDRIRDEVLKQLEREGALWKKIADVLKGNLLPHQITDSRVPAPAPQYVTVLGGWDPWMRGGDREGYGKPRWGRGDRVRAHAEGWAAVAGRVGIGYGGQRVGTGSRNLASLWGQV